MNLTVQPQMNHNVTFNSLKSKGIRTLAYTLPLAALLSIVGCKSDSFEKQNSDTCAESDTNVENLSATRYHYDWDSTATGIKHLDAIQYKVGNNEKQLILDSWGNVDVEHTYKHDNNDKFIGYESIHHNSNGTDNLSAHRVVRDDINDSTSVTRLYDIDGDLISNDSVVSHKSGGSDSYYSLGNSKLLKK